QPLRKTPRGRADADGAHSLLEGETPCEYSFAYESLIGEGVAEFLEADADKVRGLEAIMRHQADHKVAPEYPPAALRAVAVGRIAVSNWTGKRHLPR
ncbi:MAG: hypothetical protein LIO46_04280, partial [Clostridiales bacterium]|nr:hypothetical protein [Clostridiales bacterium]